MGHEIIEFQGQPCIFSAQQQCQDFCRSHGFLITSDIRSVQQVSQGAVPAFAFAGGDNVSHVYLKKSHAGEN